MSVHKVKITARLRPRLPAEQDDGGITVYSKASTSASTSKSQSATSINVDLSGGSNGGGGANYISVVNPRDADSVFRFPFSSCYDQTSTQQEIFDNDVRPLIDVVFQGVTVTIFAYGVTSSGKTHTMQGTNDQPGVIPRVVRELFGRRVQLAGQEVSIAASYMEIYKDEVYDLLVVRDTAPKLPVRENEHGEVFVAGLALAPLSSVEDFDTLYANATKNRSTGATKLNRASSRSHAVLTLEVTVIDRKAQQTLKGKINLVDLAGSENNKLTGNDPTRMAESSAINKSLSALGQVVHALNQGHTRIPYRNSKLTRLLQDALGGNSVGLLICNLAPGLKFRQDTLNTLNFAVRTKNVENKPVVNAQELRLTRPAWAHAVTGPRASLPVTTTSQPLAAAVPVSTTLPNIPANAKGPRPSLVPVRVPRPSIIGAGGFQAFAIPNAAPAPAEGAADKKEDGLGADIEQRIAKLVEQEVKKRLEAERAAQEPAASSSAHARSPSMSKSPEPVDAQANGEKKGTLPSGVLTPLLKRHRDLDDELKARLAELEQKFERGNKEMQLADVLSPVSKKKTGRAYVALARAHSEKGDLQIALDLYRKAAGYVPDNNKLRERIIEIEYAVKNNQPFEASPRAPPKKARAKSDAKNKGKGKGRGKKRGQAPHAGDDINAQAGTSAAPAEAGEAVMEVDEDEVARLLEASPSKSVAGTGRGGRKGKRKGFGRELQNRDQEEVDAETPAKKARVEAEADVDADADIPMAQDA